MTRRYESVFIVTPVLTEKQLSNTVKKIKSFLEKNGAKILYEENWGLKKLAYPIQKNTNGFYYLLEFESQNSNIVSKLEKIYRLDERIIRYITVKMDKHAIKFAESRRKRNNRFKKEEKTTGATTKM